MDLMSVLCGWDGEFSEGLHVSGGLLDIRCTQREMLTNLMNQRAGSGQPSTSTMPRANAGRMTGESIMHSNHADPPTTRD